MQRLLLIFCFLFTQTTLAQKGWIHIKKNGFKKVKTFAEGNALRFKTSTGQLVYGTLTLVKKDSVYVNGYAFVLADIKTIYLGEKTRKTFSAETLLYTTAGVAISTAGMTLAKWANFKRALRYSVILGYGNFLIQYLPGLKRKKYKIGKKFSLQTLDLHF